MRSVTIQLLGGFTASVNGKPVPKEAWRQRRAAELVKLLALAPGHRLHREQVIDALWRDLPIEAGAANLHKAAHYARRALGDRDSIGLEKEQVALWPGASRTIDSERFASLAEKALREGDPDACSKAAAAYTGDLLPEDRYEEWAQTPRERLRRLYLDVLRRAGLWERVIAEEPTDEAAHQALMRLYAETGNRSAALTQFHLLTDVLARELGVAPSSESLALYREIAHAPLEASPVKYVRAAGVSIAYQVVEGGPADLLLIPGWVSHLQLDWEEPWWVAWGERMTSFARLIRFDKRGTGLSDRPPGVQPLEERMQDAEVVLDAVGAERVHVLGWSEGGPLGILLAAMHPERVESLVLYGTQACFRRAPDYPWGETPQDIEAFAAAIERDWGTLDSSARFAPGGDSAFARRWAAYQKAAASPSAAAALLSANYAIDIRRLLPEIRVPTLVLNRRDDPIAPAEAGRYMAERIPGARFVALEGDDHLMWVGDVDRLCSEIEEFVTRLPAYRPVAARAR
jgi:DNA-binding SARP family transcriptional activator/pimeloyl-ACP methyl ester carboxylesterase